MAELQPHNPHGYLDPKLNGAPGADFPCSMLKWMKLHMSPTMEFSMARTNKYFKQPFHGFKDSELIKEVVLLPSGLIYHDSKFQCLSTLQRILITDKLTIGCYRHLPWLIRKISYSTIHTLAVVDTDIDFNNLMKLVPTTVRTLYFRNAVVFNSTGSVMAARHLRGFFPQARVYYRIPTRAKYPRISSYNLRRK